MKSRRKPARKAHANSVATRREYPIPWKTFVREVTDTVAPTEEQAAKLAVESRRTATAVIQYLFQPLPGKPAA